MLHYCVQLELHELHHCQHHLCCYTKSIKDWLTTLWKADHALAAR